MCYFLLADVNVTSKKLVCVPCRIPEDVVRSWTDSFEKVMSSEGEMNIVSVQNIFVLTASGLFGWNVAVEHRQVVLSCLYT